MGKGKHIQTLYTETENGSECEIHVHIEGKKTAWDTPTRHEYIFINVLNELDLKLIDNLGLPRWYFDYTGKGMVFEKYKQEYVCITQLNALKLKTPYRNEK